MFIIENASHIEMDKWATLLGLTFLFCVLYVKSGWLLLKAHQFDTHRASQRIQETTLEGAVMEQPTEDPNNPLTSRPSSPKVLTFGDRIRSKLFGVLLVLFAAVIRYVIEIHKENVKYSEMWQVHATFGMIILFCWIYGGFSRNPRGWDFIANIAFGLWTYFLFI